MEPSKENEFVNWRWGYVIVLAKFQFMFLDAGIAKSFGVLIPEMVARFDTDYATVGFICSLPSTLTYCACPLVSLVLERGNHRLVALAGSTMSAACLVSCAFSPNITVLGVLLALTGVGLACVFLPMTILINSYFPDKFILMNTVTLYGLTAGATFLPLIVERSEEAYGYFGSFLVIGGISCNIIVCAAAIRQPILKKRSQRHHQGQKDGPERTDGQMDRLVSNQSQRKQNGQHGQMISRNDDGLRETVKANVSHGEDCLSGVLPEVENWPLIDNDTNTDMTEEGEVSEANSLIGREMKPNESLPWYKSFFTATLFHNRLFLFNIPTYFLSCYPLYAWMLFLVPHAEQLGISQSRAVFLSSIAGIGGIIGRTISIIVIKKNVNILLMDAIAGFIGTMTLLLDFVGTVYLVRAGLAFIQGLCFFIADAVGFAIMKSTVPDERDFKHAAALVSFLIGLGSTAAGYGTGFMFDVTQSYTMVFMITGAIHAVIVINVIITLLLLRNRTSVVKNNNQ